MTFEDALRDRLKADAAVLASVSDNGRAVRIHWVTRPEKGGLPAVTLQIVAGAVEQHMDGVSGTQRCIVQADCWALKHNDVVALADAVTAALMPRAAIGGLQFDRAAATRPRDLGEQTTGGFVHRRSIDFTFHYHAD